MADVTRRTNRKVADYLDDGEEIEVAVLCEPKGTYGAGMFAVAAWPVAGSSVLSDRQAQAIDAQVGIVEKFPASSCVLAVSSRRVYVFPSNGLRFQDPTLVLQRCDVMVGEVTRRGLGKVVQIVFIDGSAIEVDTQVGQPIDRLVDALGMVAPIR